MCGAPLPPNPPLFSPPTRRFSAPVTRPPHRCEGPGADLRWGKGEGVGGREGGGEGGGFDNTSKRCFRNTPFRRGAFLPSFRHAPGARPPTRPRGSQEPRRVALPADSSRGRRLKYILKYDPQSTLTGCAVMVGRGGFAPPRELALRRRVPRRASDPVFRGSLHVLLKKCQDLFQTNFAELAFMNFGPFLLSFQRYRSPLPRIPRPLVVGRLFRHRTPVLGEGACKLASRESGEGREAPPRRVTHRRGLTLPAAPLSIPPCLARRFWARLPRAGGPPAPV